MTEAPAGKDDVDEDLAADLRRASKGHLPAPEQQLHSPDPMAAAVNGKMHTRDTYCRILCGGRSNCSPPCTIGIGCKP